MHKAAPTLCEGSRCLGKVSRESVYALTLHGGKISRCRSCPCLVIGGAVHERLPLVIGAVYERLLRPFLGIDHRRARGAAGDVSPKNLPHTPADTRGALKSICWHERRFMIAHGNMTGLHGAAHHQLSKALHHLLGQTGNHHRGSNDDRWMGVWGTKGSLLTAESSLNPLGMAFIQHTSTASMNW